MLVANKCDGLIEDFAATVQAVDQRARELLEMWQEDREIPDMTEVTLLRPSSLVSCRDGGGLSKVVDRIASHGATSTSVPPAWGLALTFLDALREKRDPFGAARECLGLDASPKKTPKDAAPSLFMTKAALFELWKGVVESVGGDLSSEAEKMAVSNPESALEGALWIR